MRNLAIRVLVTLVAVAIIWILIPIVLRLVGLNLGGDIETVLRLVIGLSALYYIVWGQTPALPPNT